MHKRAGRAGAHAPPKKNSAEHRYVAWRKSVKYGDNERTTVAKMSFLCNDAVDDILLPSTPIIIYYYLRMPEAFGHDVYS